MLRYYQFVDVNAAFGRPKLGGGRKGKVLFDIWRGDNKSFDIGVLDKEFILTFLFP